MSSRVYLFFPPRRHDPPPTVRDRLNPPEPLTPSLSSPQLCQTPGCRSGCNRSTLSPSHPVFPATIRFGSRPPLIRMSVFAHKSLLVRNVVAISCIITTVLYCTTGLLYWTLPYFNMYHNPMKQSSFFPFVLFLTPITPMYRLYCTHYCTASRLISYYYCCHNKYVRYSIV